MFKILGNNTKLPPQTKGSSQQSYRSHCAFNSASSVASFVYLTQLFVDHLDQGNVVNISFSCWLSGSAGSLKR